MKRLRQIRLSVGLAILGAIAAMLMVGPAVAAPDSTDSQVAKDLAAVRQATAKYHDVENALADGFVSLVHCVSSPAGAMGVHYLNPGRLDGNIDLLEPEVLLYAPTPSGDRLVAVEYFLPIGGPDDPIPDPAPPAPVLFGHTSNGPMLGHEPGMPPHYDFHVWVWQANPNGIFEEFNPKISCP